MPLLVLKAYWNLVVFDLCLAKGNFADVYNRVRNCPIDTKPPRIDTVVLVCSAIDTACIWYRKQVLCLQRSAATACLLKRNGVAAQMVIGAQMMPFKAHAWVEVNGSVVSDKPYMQEMYQVLDRC
jgi:Transglutaminase-like superfamily